MLTFEAFGGAVNSAELNVGKRIRILRNKNHLSETRISSHAQSVSDATSPLTRRLAKSLICMAHTYRRRKVSIYAWYKSHSQPHARLGVGRSVRRAPNQRRVGYY